MVPRFASKAEKPITESALNTRLIGLRPIPSVAQVVHEPHIGPSTLLGAMENDGLISSIANIQIRRRCKNPYPHIIICSARMLSSAARGYDRQWRKARATYLQNHPLCEACKAEGRVRAARVVDHIQPHRGNRTLFWDYLNWRALCEQCHNRKTMTKDRAHREGKAPYVDSACDANGMPLDPNHHWHQNS